MVRFRVDVVCFHNPNEENGYLSNWYLSQFCVDKIVFSSMEQYMMYKKATCFGDDKIAEQILGIDDTARIKELGRLVTGYSDNYWSGIRQVVVYEGLLAKFLQNDGLRERLLDTGNRIIAECAVNDHIWGIGLSMGNPDRLDLKKWKGQNLLGYSLMMVRDKL